MPHEESLREPRPLTRQPGHHFFGYYDRCPYSYDQRYVLGLKVDFIDRPPVPEDEAEIGLIDTQNADAWQALDTTTVWNWQQGNMLHWLPPEDEPRIIHNTIENGRYVSVIRRLDGKIERTLPRPVYGLSRDGKQAAMCNFSRVHWARPGYGYEELPDPGKDDPAPADDGLWTMDIETGEVTFAVSIAQCRDNQALPEMADTTHWFNHLQWNTTGTRIAFLHRWHAPSGGFVSRLYAVSPDGGDLRILADDRGISHYDWRDGEYLLAWARQPERGMHFFLFHDSDTADKAALVGPDVLPQDGHCSYSPDRRWILTDTYPFRDGKRTLILYQPEDDLRIDVARLYSPPELDGEIRCDLHPRWSRDGQRICLDSAHTGERQIYELDVSDIVSG